MPTSVDSMHQIMDAEKTNVVVAEPKAEVSWREWTPGPITKVSSTRTRNAARKKNKFRRAKNAYLKRNPTK